MALEPRLPKPAFDAAIQRLARDGGLVPEGAFLRLAVARGPPDAGRRGRLGGRRADARGGGAISPAAGSRHRDRNRSGGSGDPRPAQAGARMGRADEVAHDHFFLRATVREMTGVVAELAATEPGGEFAAAQFRDRVDNGRKVAIQILEFFDRHGVTLRRGDLRRVNPHRLDLFGGG